MERLFQEGPTQEHRRNSKDLQGVKGSLEVGQPKQRRGGGNEGVSCGSQRDLKDSRQWSAGLNGRE